MGKSISVFLAGLILGVLLATAGFSMVLRRSSRSGASRSGVAESGASGSGASGLAAQQSRVLKLAHSLDPSHPVHLGMLHMKERLEAISSGSMSIEIYPSAVLGGEVECIEQLQNGVLAMTKTSTGPMEAFVPQMQVFGLPYLFVDGDHFWKFADSELGKGLLHKGSERNMYGLCYYDAGSRNFYTKGRQIKAPEDLKGLKIRVMNSPMAIKMVEMMGASPTPISWGELYSALAQGTVDGAENNLPSFYSNKHYEPCQFFSLDGHVVLPDMLLIGTPIWNQLSDQEKSWLQQAADESSRFQRELWATMSSEALEAIKELGVEVYQPDKQPFMDKVAPMYEQFQGTEIGDLVQQIRAMEPLD
ncbi:2,3-diketo-L-gulonate-binding periplasmic protein YiaO precursor [Planctomycetes bacterium CA13]|uniref:2,3-diketo-L-gulonate-binding periplasmic protein YiaO n=1 Tax=Novipirellula herctigrandis TaxID=2527986 RepID=A0A5C5YWP1_9BACT|nr:2,3-diketo-L-gulonate-binding periplasmic protein YiaO precursor [Planctomycetes bacterium CA13]